MRLQRPRGTGSRRPGRSSPCAAWGLTRHLPGALQGGGRAARTRPERTVGPQSTPVAREPLVLGQDSPPNGMVPGGSDSAGPHRVPPLGKPPHSVSQASPGARGAAGSRGRAPPPRPRGGETQTPESRRQREFTGGAWTVPTGQGGLPYRAAGAGGRALAARADALSDRLSPCWWSPEGHLASGSVSVFSLGWDLLLWAPNEGHQSRALLEARCRMLSPAFLEAGAVSRWAGPALEPEGPQRLWSPCPGWPAPSCREHPPARLGPACAVSVCTQRPL